MSWEDRVAHPNADRHHVLSLHAFPRTSCAESGARGRLRKFLRWLVQVINPPPEPCTHVCGVLPRQESRTPLFERRPHSGGLRPAAASSSKQGPGLDHSCGGVPQLWPSLGMRLL